MFKVALLIGKEKYGTLVCNFVLVNICKIDMKYKLRCLIHTQKVW